MGQKNNAFIPLKIAVLTVSDSRTAADDSAGDYLVSALTDAGHDLLSTTQAMLQQLAVGIRRLGQYQKPNQLVLNTTPIFARHWLLPRLADFHQRYPNIALDIRVGNETIDFRTQNIDTGFAYSDHNPVLMEFILN